MGKSTLIDLLQRFYDPDAGRILLDGTDLRELDLQALRRRIAVVSQDIVLFRGTLAQNLAYSTPEASLADLERVVRLTQLQSLVQSLPLGLDVFARRAWPTVVRRAEATHRHCPRAGTGPCDPVPQRWTATERESSRPSTSCSPAALASSSATVPRPLPMPTCTCRCRMAIKVRPRRLPAMATELRIGVIDSGCSPEQAATLVAARRWLEEGVLCEGEPVPDHRQQVGLPAIGGRPVAGADGPGLRSTVEHQRPAGRRALLWLVEEGATLVNLSLGLHQDRPVLRQACAEAQAAGVLLCASSPARWAGVSGQLSWRAAYHRRCRCAPGQWSWLGSGQADLGGYVAGRAWPVRAWPVRP